MKPLRAMLLMVCLELPAFAVDQGEEAAVTRAVTSYAEAGAALAVMARDRPWLTVQSQNKVVVRTGASGTEEGKKLSQLLLEVGRKRMGALVQAIDEGLAGVDKPVASFEKITGETIKLEALGPNGAYREGRLRLAPDIVFETVEPDGRSRSIAIYNGWELKVILDRSGVVRRVDISQVTDGRKVDLNRE